MGQLGLLLHSEDGGQNWSRLFLDTKLPGEPYMVTALGKRSAELATNVGAVYRTNDAGGSWQAQVEDAVGAVRDLRRSPEGNYISVSSLGNFFDTWSPGEPRWTPHQRESSQRLQSMGFQPNGNLWMLARGAQLRFTGTRRLLRSGASRWCQSPMAMATWTGPGIRAERSGPAEAAAPCL